jgi:hypothetical protein
MVTPLRKRNILFLLLLAYSTLVFFGVYHHEPWRDEAHPWNSAKEDAVSQILEGVHYAPTPALWTLLLVPLAKFGLPYRSMNVLCALIAIASVSLLLFHSRLPLIIKILFTFSYYMAYEYAVIARPYILTSFSLFGIAALYRKRLDRPIVYAFFVSLLFQTTIYSAFSAGILFVVFCCELYKQKTITFQRIGAVVMMSSVALFTFISYIPHTQGAYRVAPPDMWVELSRVLLNAVSSSLIFKLFDAISFIASPLEIIIVTVTAMVFVGVILLVACKKSLLLIAGISFYWLFFTNIALNDGTLRHQGLLLIYLIFFLWISPRYTRIFRVMFYIQETIYALLGALLICSVASSAYAYSMDYQYNFSGAKDMATYIISHDLLKKNITMYTAADGEALLPYMDKKFFWYPQLNNYTRFHINDNRAVGIPQSNGDDIINSTHDHFNEDALYLLSEPIGESDPRFRLLHASLVKNFWGNGTEQFWLYSRIL